MRLPGGHRSEVRMPRIQMTCANCGQTFMARPCEYRNGRRFCSLSCFGTHRRADPVARFWENVAKSPDCWLWMGAVRSGGYGTLTIGARDVAAHRFSWDIHFGPIPPGAMICHHCDNPRCIRPDHLFMGDAASNIADMFQKGRQGPRWIGERHGRAKLNEANVVEIRRLRSEDSVAFRKIADIFGISIGHARKIAHRQEWSHVR